MANKDYGATPVWSCNACTYQTRSYEEAIAHASSSKGTAFTHMLFERSSATAYPTRRVVVAPSGEVVTLGHGPPRT